MTIDINKVRVQLDSDCIIDHIELHANLKPILTTFLDRLEAAERERDWHADRCEDAMSECASLRAKIAEMEQQTPSVPDGVAEALQRLIEKNTVSGLGSSEDALLVARYRQHLLACAPSVPEGFSREDLEAVADGLDGYEKTVNVGNVTGEGDDPLESTTAYAARFIRAMLAATEAKP